MKNKADLYLDKVKEQLICGGKRKRDILRRFSADVEAFAEALGGDCSMEALEAEFGTPQYAAQAALRMENVSAVRKTLSTKKTIIGIVAAACIIALLIILGYLAHDRALKEAYANGRYVEAIYEHTVEGTPPPEPEDAKINGE